MDWSLDRKWSISSSGDEGGGCEGGGGGGGNTLDWDGELEENQGMVGIFVQACQYGLGMMMVVVSKRGLGAKVLDCSVAPLKYPILCGPVLPSSGLRNYTLLDTKKSSISALFKSQ